MSSQWNIKHLVYYKNQCNSPISWCAKLYKKFFVIFYVLLTINCVDIVNGHFLQIDQNAFRALSSPIFVPHVDSYTPSHIHAHPQQHQPTYHSTGFSKSKKELSAAEVMVDISNDLTYRILHYHSILNRNNFAFSPTALMSILVALYEGAEGRSAKELKNVLFLPNNRDVVRVGYRDIHRRLRTYFFESENPLRGLCMNRPNITITRDYETVLMFYGYDIGMDMLSPTKNLTSSATETNISKETELMATTMPIPTTTISTTAATSTTPPATTSITTTTTTTTSAPTTTSTTEIPTTVTVATSTTTTSPTTPNPSTTPATTTTTEETATTTIAETTTIATENAKTTDEPGTTEAAETTTEAGSSEAAELISAFVAEENAEPLLRIQKARVVRLPNAKLQAPPRTNYLPQSARKLAATARMARNKRNLWESVDLDASLFLSLFKPEQFLQQSQPHNLYNLPDVFFATDLEPPIQSNLRTSTHHQQLQQQQQQKQQNYNADVINHIFYLNNQDIIHTTFKVYNAVLYYKYYEALRLNVLELELDSKQYNLMILLPDFHVDLTTAAASLRLGPTLRAMRKSLKPRWVQAIIPDFHLHGNMYLTNDLQNLGIYDIFEPNRADLRPMTEEPGVYVKHIEQSINVHIRTHPINQHKRNYGAQTQPIQLSVNHPFMFFIIDRDLDVAVMAGRVLNPLNVRIQ